MDSHLNTFIDSLALDHRRGAAEIVHDGIGLFREITHLAERNPLAAEQLFGRAVRRLAKGQLSMAPLLNLLNRICRCRERTGADWGRFSVLLEEELLPEFSRVREIEGKIKYLPRIGSSIITFSNSSTVANVIIACYQRFKWPERVICGEGRPLREGVYMAQKIRAGGVPVTLYTDAAMMSQIDRADAVWVGGDSLSRQGLVNKVGSKALAMLTRLAGIPFLSLMCEDKLLPPSLLPYTGILPQNPHEIVAEEAEALDIVNAYYEIVPLELITRIFTEHGLIEPEKLVAAIDDEPVSSLFRALVED